MEKVYFHAKDVSGFGLFLQDLRNYVIGGEIDPYRESHELWPMLSQCEREHYKQMARRVKSRIRTTGEPLVRQPEALPARVKTIIFNLYNSKNKTAFDIMASENSLGQVRDLTDIDHFNTI